jgi:DNA repair photolyase
MDSNQRKPPRKGSGATVSPPNRFAAHHAEAVDDGWGSLDEPVPVRETTLSVDSSRSIIAYNQSPDVGFDRSINPYKGCEHGCVYCFARPTHAYLDLSPGLDFETRLFYKPDAPELLRQELGRPRYQCAPITVGINTDAYQPAERRLQLTRAILEVLVEHRHPFTIVTKSALVERDLDLIAPAAAEGRAAVCVSVTTLDRNLSRRIEPRAAAPQRRLETIRTLTEAGIPVSVLVAPIIPVLTDPELERILEQSCAAGAQSAGYVLLRLPHELKALFIDWLRQHEPLKAEHVMNRVRETRGGKEYDARFGVRMRGTGTYAELIQRRFELAKKRFGFGAHTELDSSQFTRPNSEGQLTLF